MVDVYVLNRTGDRGEPCGRPKVNVEGLSVCPLIVMLSIR